MATKGRFGFLPVSPEINRDTCRKCGLCAEVCGGEPLVFKDGEVIIDENAEVGCLGCGGCMMICPTQSVSVRGRDISPDDLLELPSSDSRASPESLENLLLARRSIRQFRSQPVEREKLDKILRIASTAPMGIPPSEVGIIVFHGHDNVQVLANDVMDNIKKTLRWFHPFVMIVMRPFLRRTNYDYYELMLKLGRMMIEGRERGDDPLLYRAPVAILFHYSPYGAPDDCHIAATYAMIAAESMGLGTCLIGMASPFLGRDRKLMAKYGIPKLNKPDLVLIFGYPDISFKRAIRRRFSSVSYFGE